MDWINFVNVYICCFIALGHASKVPQTLPDFPAFRGKNEALLTTKSIHQNIKTPNRPQLNAHEENQLTMKPLSPQAQILEALRKRTELLNEIPQHLNEIPKQSHIMPLLKSLKGNIGGKGRKLKKIPFKESQRSSPDEIPTKFEIKGPEAYNDFKRYVDDINGIVQNLTVNYKVKVELVKPKHKESRKMNFRRKSKKFNVPLKKKSMQVSQFENILRKLAEESDVVSEKETAVSETTEPEIHVVTRKNNPISKYKPIISRFKKDYVKKINNKRVKPIKTSEYTLH